MNLSSLQVGPAELYDEVVWGPEDLLAEVTVNMEQSYHGNVSLHLQLGRLSNLCDQTVLADIEYYYNGRCFSLHLPDCLTSRGILELQLNLLQPVDVFIHHAGQFLSPDSRARVDIRPGTNKKIAVTHEVRQDWQVLLVRLGRWCSCWETPVTVSQATAHTARPSTPASPPPCTPSCWRSSVAR